MAVSSMQSLPQINVRRPSLDNGRAEHRTTQVYDPSWRESTIASRSAAVDRVILEIRRRLDEPISLSDMADIAHLSPFHFNRVFRKMTGVSPGRFLTTLRMEAAKRLLSESEMRIIDVCFAVGYNSVGTFTTQFAQLVGLAPGRYRRLHRIDGVVEPEEFSGPRDHLVAEQTGGAINGWVGLSDPSPFWIFVGVFPTPVPCKEPIACALLTGPGPFHLAPVPDGSYYLLAAAISRSGGPVVSAPFDELVAYVGSSHERLVMRAGRIIEGHTGLNLRPLSLSDPPILIVLPLLLLRHETSAKRSIA